MDARVKADLLEVRSDIRHLWAEASSRGLGGVAERLSSIDAKLADLYADLAGISARRSNTWLWGVPTSELAEARWEGRIGQGGPSCCACGARGVFAHLRCTRCGFTGTGVCDRDVKSAVAYAWHKAVEVKP